MYREQPDTLQPRTKVVYLPVINKPPSEPSTMMAAMLKAKASPKKTGQDFVLFTAYEHLYRVAVHILWYN